MAKKECLICKTDIDYDTWLRLDLFVKGNTDNAYIPVDNQVTVRICPTCGYIRTDRI